MNKVVILPVALLPNLDYVKVISQSEIVKIEKFETFPKQTYRNRYHIAGPNGMQKLIIPVSKTDNVLETKDIAISYDEDWPRIHWRSIVTAYNSAPFFLYYKDDFESVFLKKHKSLFSLNMEFLQLILDFFNIKTKIEFTESYEKNPENTIDLRFEFHPRNQVYFSNYPEYYQVFKEKYGFLRNLSAIDLLFNLGPESMLIINSIS